MDEAVLEVVKQLPALALFVFFVLRQLKSQDAKAAADRAAIEKITQRFSEQTQSNFEQVMTLGNTVSRNTEAIEHLARAMESLEKKLISGSI